MAKLILNKYKLHIFISLALLFSVICIQNVAPKFFNFDREMKANKNEVVLPGFHDYFQKHFNKDMISSMSTIERALYANYVVSNFCKNETPHIKNDQLFLGCQTACQGFAFVLIKTLNQLGIQAGYFNIYNVPQQGNHVLVEADIAGKKLHLDPTYNTVFFNGDTPSTIFDACKNSSSLIKEISVSSSGIAITPASNERLKKKYFLKEHYCRFEDYTSPTKKEYILTLDLAKYRNFRWGTQKIKVVEDIDSTLLKYTNQYLNDGEPKNDVSYLFSYVGEYGGYSQGNRIEFNTSQSTQKLNLSVWSADNVTLFTGTKNGGQIDIEPGFQNLVIEIPANESNILLTTKQGYLRLLFVELR